MSDIHQLLRAIVDGLNLRTVELGSSAARGFFDGRPVRPSTRARTLRALADSIVAYAASVAECVTRREWIQRVDRAEAVERFVTWWTWLSSEYGRDAAMIDAALRLYGGALLVLGSASRVEAVMDELADDRLVSVFPQGKSKVRLAAAEAVRISARELERWLSGTSSPTSRQRRLLVEYLVKTKRCSDAATLERRLKRWFDARSIRRAVAKVLGGVFVQDFIDIARDVAATLRGRDFLHPMDIDTVQVGPDGAPYSLLVYGLHSMSAGLALGQLAEHAPLRVQASASRLYEPIRPRPPEPVVLRPFSRDMYPWNSEPGFLRGTRLLPHHADIVNSIAKIAVERDPGPGARRLARYAESLGRPEAKDGLRLRARRRRNRSRGPK